MITEQEIKSSLNSMAIINKELESLALKKQEAIDRILTPEIRAAIEDINAEFRPMEEGAMENKNALERFVRERTIEFGKTVTGDYLQAVFTNGKKTWDTKKLTEYIKTHPELEDVYAQGDPFIQIKKVNKQNDTL